MKRLAFILLMLLLVPVQVTLLPSLSLFGIRPDLCLVAACLAGLFAGRVHGGVLGFFLGFVQDFFFAGTPWLNMFTKAAVGYLSGVVAKNVSTTAWYSAFFLMLAFSFASGTVLLLVARQGMDREAVFHGISAVLFPQAVLDGLVALVAHWILSRWMGPRRVAGDDPDIGRMVVPVK